MMALCLCCRSDVPGPMRPPDRSCILKSLPTENDKAVARRRCSSLVLGACRFRLDVRGTPAAASAAGILQRV